MVNEQDSSHEVESEDGGVPLPSIGPEPMDLDYAESSSGASTSTMSPLSLHIAQPSLNGSDTTPPTVHLILDQHGILGIHEETNETFAIEADDPASEQTPMMEENAFPALEADDPSSEQALTMEENAFPTLDAVSVGTPEPETTVHFVADPGPQNNPNPTLMPVQNLGTPAQVNSASLTASSADQAIPPRVENRDCENFLQLWENLWLLRRSEYPPINYTKPNSAIDMTKKVTVKMMSTTSCDIQGLRWSDYNTSKKLARDVRRMTTKNYGHMYHINPEQPREAYATSAYMACFKSESSPALSLIDDFFRFKETNLTIKPGYSHGQLRNCLCASSKSAVFYYDGPQLYPHLGSHTPGIKCFNPSADTVRDAMDLSKRRDSETPRLSKIACMTATDDLLIAGDLHDGHYAMKSLSTTFDDIETRGVVNKSRDSGAGINHVHTFLHRHSGVPHAVFCDNGGHVRVMDCSTTRWVSDQTWDSPVNCSATSPDGRLRIHVSDDQWPIVSVAETGETLARLPGHKDHGFACDWSPDGITMATGHQDGLVQVWDARRMKEAVHVLPAEMGGIRSLKFSPLGAGHPVLVMAEPMDFVSIVDARTFRSKQDIEFFGEISGISMPPDGGSLFIGNADIHRGGIFEFERTGYNGDFKHRNLRCSNLQPRRSHKRQAMYNTSPDDSDREVSVNEASTEARLKRRWKIDDHNARIWHTREHDWALEADIDDDRRTVLTRKQRWRRDLGLDEFNI